MMTSSLGGSSLTSFNGVLSSGLGSMGAPPQQNRSSGPPRPQISEEDKAILQSQYETISAFIEENIAGLLPSIMATYDTAGVGYLDAKALSVFARDFLVANASVAGTQGEPPKQAIQGTVAAWHANLQVLGQGSWAKSKCLYATATTKFSLSFVGLGFACRWTRRTPPPTWCLSRSLWTCAKTC